MTGKTIAELRPGDHAELVREIRMAEIGEFVDAVGDHNPLHSDPAFAATTPFHEPIAPGVFTAGLISAVIGTELPGPGTVYLSQSLKFLRPVKPGDRITTRVEILEVVRERNRVRLGTVCRNARGEEVLTGEAWVMPPRTAITYEPAARPGVALSPYVWAAQAMAFWSRLSLAVLSAATSAGRR